MKKSLFTIFSAAMLLFSVADTYAINLPVKEVNGSPVYYYTVVKGDKLSRLADKIGVTKAQMLEYNPQVSDGFIPGTVITFPVTIDATVKDGFYVTSYKVDGNESVYGVAKRFDIPLDRLLRFNPAAETGIKGMTLTIPLYKASDDLQSADAEPVAPVQKQSQPIPAGCFPYLVKLGDTLPKIARENGLMEKDIVTVNPDTDFNNLQLGEMIYLPQVQSLAPAEERIGRLKGVAVAPVAVEEQADPQDSVAEEETVGINEVSEDEVDPDVAEESQPLSIAVMLPFMLGSEETSRTSQLYTEFYRGFLMGVEELSHSGTPVNIAAYDTQDSPETVEALLARPELAHVNIFIAPDNQQQLQMMAERAKESDDSYLLNIFAVKDESYLANPSVIQANIPHPAMYRKAIDSFVDRYSDRVPVFISRVGGSGEKIEFTDSLKARLQALGRDYKEINFKNFLGRDNLEHLNADSVAYVFVPGSGSRQEFSKFAPAIKNLRNAALIRDNVVLYGYPEYIMFRGDNLDMLHSLNATIYSRYLALPDFEEVKQCAEKYREFYGEDMEEAVPMQALIGYDTARFLIDSLRNNEGAFADSSMDYDGVQMGYSLEPVTDGGLVNENLYLIEYRPGGKLAKIRL